MSHSPERLYFETYLAMINNSVDSRMFQNFYLMEDGRVFDALEGGTKACALYVSALLKIFDKIGSLHGTVSSTVEDLQKSGWQPVSKPIHGDVVVWEAMQFDDGTYRHIGFAAGHNKAVSASWREQKIVMHDLLGQRAIEQVLRYKDWD